MAGLRALAFWIFVVAVFVVPGAVVAWFVIKLVRVLYKLAKGGNNGR